jgi:hypothetical protein
MLATTKLLSDAVRSPVTNNDFWFCQDSALSIQHFRTDCHLFFPEHTHSEYNIVICVAGKIRVDLLGTTETLDTGDLALGNSGLAHSSEYAVDGELTEAVSLTLSHRLPAVARRIRASSMARPRTTRLRWPTA